MKITNKYVGLDVHKDTTVIAVADGGRDGRDGDGTVRRIGTSACWLALFE